MLSSQPLRHGFHGYGFHRISDEHRLVYRMHDDAVRIAACRYHDEQTSLRQVTY